MLTEPQMKTALHKYLDGFNQDQPELIITLFADDATIEDPVGGGQVVEGKEQIAAFYRQGVPQVEELKLDTPIRGSYSRAAAMAFTIHMEREGQKIRIQAIDVMTFNDSGKITEMKAYHGPSNVIEK